jgi:hypothetical protein
MAGARTLTGAVTPRDAPDWRPLEALIKDERLEDFMWMFEVALEDGALVEVYKHYLTRGYLHLDDRSRAFYFTGDGHYVEVDARIAQSAVFRRAPTDLS